MEVVRGWQDVPASLRGAAVALGNFDGVHRGHARVVRDAHGARPDAPLAVLTFEPHPREYFRPDDPPFRLTLPEARREALAGLGVRILYELPFDAALSALSADAFVQEVLHRGIGAAHLSCGPDFAFGHRRGGDTDFLALHAERIGVGLTVVAPLSDAQGTISSTRIRRLLQDGYPERAAALLGRPWCVRGPVTHGDQRGRTIGYPTANVPLGRHLEPARGVYAVQVRAPGGELVAGVANIGRRPTVAEGLESRVEAHLFDWSGDLYGQEVDVLLHTYLRPEQKFGSFAELRAQIDRDAEAAQAALAGLG